MSELIAVAYGEEDTAGAVMDALLQMEAILVVRHGAQQADRSSDERQVIG